MEDMLTLLRKMPDKSSFKWMFNWQDVSDTKNNQEARNLFEKKDQCYLDLLKIDSAINLLAFLRYDYKKILVRTRYLYVDRLKCNDTQIKGTDLDMAFFEPILLCFPTLEFMGRILFSEDVSWSVKKPKTNEILERILKHMGGGYSEHASRLTSFHRHSLSHELRPDGFWTYDLNTEKDYGPPKENDGNFYLNIPHFIDSSLFMLEEICTKLASENKDENKEAMNKFSYYLSQKGQRRLGRGFI